MRWLISTRATSNTGAARGGAAGGSHVDEDGRLKTYQTRPKAPMPTGCRSEYLEVISKVVPKI